MDKPTTITVAEVVGSPICVASDDGQYVFERTVTEICSERDVVLSFAGVTALTPAFLNAAIGQLYSRFDGQEIRDRLKFTDIGSDDLVLVNWVVETAKRYIKDPGRFDHLVNEVMGRI